MHIHLFHYILHDLHWLPSSQRINYKVLLLTYKALHGEGPIYLRDLLCWHVPRRSLRSGNELLLQIPKTRLKTFGDRAFQAAAPRLWNSLPIHIRQSKSTNIFKGLLKTHLFKAAYDWCSLVLNCDIMCLFYCDNVWTFINCFTYMYVCASEHSLDIWRHINAIYITYTWNQQYAYCVLFITVY